MPLDIPPRPPGVGPPPDMTADQFAALAALLWGDDWRRRAATLLGVNLRNVQFWTARPPARCKPIPHGVAGELIAEVRRRVEAGGAEADRLAEAGRQALARGRLLANLTAREFPDPRGG
jgi:hypothetical protein